MTLPKTAIKYRTATETDIDFLDRLHTVCLKEHVNRIYSWKPNLFRQTIKLNLIQIIVVDDIDVVMIQTEQKEDELYIGNLLILPVFQNRGIGTTVLKDF